MGIRTFIKRAAIVTFGAGAAYGAVNNAFDDQTAFQTAKTTYDGVHGFTSRVVDSISKDEQGNPSTSLLAKGSKWVLWTAAPVSAIGAYVGNGVVTAGHYVKEAGVWAYDYFGTRVPDDKPASAISTSTPQPPQVRINSYRVDDKKLG